MNKDSTMFLFLPSSDNLRTMIMMISTCFNRLLNLSAVLLTQMRYTVILVQVLMSNMSMIEFTITGMLLMCLRDMHQQICTLTIPLYLLVHIPLSSILMMLVTIIANPFWTIDIMQLSLWSLEHSIITTIPLDSTVLPLSPHQRSARFMTSLVLCTKEKWLTTICP
jgi:hypothetical protein